MRLPSVETPIWFDDLVPAQETRRVLAPAARALCRQSHRPATGNTPSRADEMEPITADNLSRTSTEPGSLNRFQAALFRHSRPAPRATAHSEPSTRITSGAGNRPAEVRQSLLSLRVGWGGWLRRKLEYCRLSCSCTVFARAPGGNWLPAGAFLADLTAGSG